MERIRTWLLDGDGSGSGSAVAWVFQRGLAAIQAIAFASLAVQVQGLIGQKGLLPWSTYAATLEERGVSFWQAPSLLRWTTGDAVLQLAAVVGVVLALVALADLRARLLLGVNGLLYLSFMNAGRTFFTFQWDSLLVEATLLAVFLPTDRRARWVHVLFRVLLFKLYFESGIAKWQSALGDWQSGSAMTLYYETAPLPTRLAWYAHHLPVAWHHFEAWATLVLELVVPFLVFGPRLARRLALAAFTVFQLADIATANYGFFCWLALVLSVFLLDDADLRLVKRPLHPPGRLDHPLPIALAMSIYLFLSGLTAAASFSRSELPEWAGSVLRATAPFSAVNVFHLFGSITTERLEPIVETRQDGRWTPRWLRHKPGDPNRAPDFVAPHQPRLDFQLWFYGLRPRPTPAYVTALLEQVCLSHSAIDGFFAEPLPHDVDAVRIRFARYTFTTADERARTGAWWHVQDVGLGPMIDCERIR